MFTVCLVLGLLIIVTPDVRAFTITIDRIVGYYSGNGGEFNIAPSDLPGVSGYVSSTLIDNRYHKLGFETFCLETGEFVTIPGTYNAVINSKAIMGNNSPNGDPISVGTAWLYDQFARGVLTGYNYTPGADRIASADLLQRTIWWLEGETGYSDPGGTFSTQVKLVPNYTENNDGYYPVAVLNLTVPGTETLAQDQLVRVPEPGILILLGIAMSAIGAASWRLRKL